MQSKPKMPDIRKLRLFDSCVTLGRVVRAGTPESLTPDNIYAVMDKHDIAEALVHENEARLALPRSKGNRRLLDEIRGMDRLHPAWALEPPKRPDRAEATAMVQEMLEAGVRAARLMMGYAPPLLWMWDDLLAALEEHRVPCFLDFAPCSYSSPYGATHSTPDAMTMDKLREICLAHPGLQMVLSHVSGGLGISYPSLPLIYRVPNLHLDITNIVDYWRNVVREVGPERVFFATGMPYYDPAILVSNVQYEPHCAEAAKRKICGDNLRTLLEAVR
jgi:predicted TIM-barrel fold metal-dependent hydrolase